MDDFTRLTLQWRELRRERVEDPTRDNAREAGDPALGVWVALGTTNALRALVSLDAEESGPRARLGRSSALAMQETSLAIRGENLRCVDIRCESADLDEIFVHFVVKLLSNRRLGLAPGPAIDRTISEFCELLGLSGVSEERRHLGDLGELFILSQLMDHDPLAIETWTGPADGRHDFRHGQKALEVKAGLRPHEKVRINRLSQLEPPETGGVLWLAVVTVEADPNGAHSLAGLARSIRMRCPHGARVQPEALERLRLIEARPDPHRYALFERRIYRIEEETPRLRAAMEDEVPPSVSAISYALGLEHLEPWAMDEAACAAMLSTFRQ